MPEQHESDRSMLRWNRVLVVSWGTIGVIVLVAVAGWLLGRLSGVLTPFLLGLVIAFLLRWPVRQLASRGVPRGWAVIICYAVLLALFAVVGVFIVPPLAAQLATFSHEFPHYYASAASWWGQVEIKYAALRVPAWLTGAFGDLTKTTTSALGSVSSNVAKGVVRLGGEAVTLVVDFFLAIILAFWLLKDLPALRQDLLRLWKPKARHEAEHILGTVSGVVGGYLRGLITVCFVTGVLSGIGLAIAGVPYALVIGLIIGVGNFFPYLGPAVAAIVTVISAAFVSPTLALVGLAIIFGVQWGTDNLISPRVMSRQVNLHPLAILFALLTGGTVFGLPGLVLAIPVAAVGKGLFVYYFEKLTETELATEDGAMFRESKERLDARDALRRRQKSGTASSEGRPGGDAGASRRREPGQGDSTEEQTPGEND
jgi:predicted PurR-regulated permease PerM